MAAEYIIRHSMVKDAQGAERLVGIDISPALSEVALRGIIQELRQPGGDTNSRNAYVSSATATRVDASGSALILGPSIYTEPSSGQSEFLAKAVCRLINPCGQLEVTFEPPVSETPAQTE